MSELRFTEDHEWLRTEADGSVTVGITAFAQNALGDVVFVQLPELQAYEKGAEAATVESVKAASGVYMPSTATYWKSTRRWKTPRNWSTKIRWAKAGSSASSLPTHRPWPNCSIRTRTTV